MFPKIHKNSPPDRPVVSSANCHTTKISKYIDHVLQPHVKEFRSYVKVSTVFIRKISILEKIPENSIFVTMEVRSLYTNIPNNEGIKAVETTLNPPCFNSKQFHFQLPKLLTNKRLCHRNKMCYKLLEYIHGYI